MTTPSPAENVDRYDAQSLALFNFMRDLHNLPPVTARPNADSTKRPELRLVREEDAS